MVEIKEKKNKHNKVMDYKKLCYQQYNKVFLNARTGHRTYTVTESLGDATIVQGQCYK